MKLPRVRFALRTLVLGTLFAGSVMLCWSVREPWGFQTWPLVTIHPKKTTQSAADSAGKIDPLLSQFDAIDTEIRKIHGPQFYGHLSASGNFIFVEHREMGLEAEVSNGILDLRRRTIIHPSKTRPDWNYFKDQIVIPGEGKVIRLRDEAIVLQAKGQLNFSNTGNYIIHAGSEQWTLYDTEHFEPMFSISPGEVDRGPVLARNDTLVLFARKVAGRTSPQVIECTEIVSGKHLWSWTVPEEGSRSFHFEDRKIWWDNSSELPGPDRLFLSSTKTRKTDGRIDNAIIYTLDLTTGKAINREVISGYQAWNCVSSYGDGEGGIRSEIDKRWLFIRTGGLEVVITSQYYATMVKEMGLVDGLGNSTNRTTEDAPESQWKLMALTAAGARISQPLMISRNAQRVAACVNGNALGIWTRRRQHFEWWGMYEQLEVWLAVVLFGALVWSGWQDCLSERDGP